MSVRAAVERDLGGLGDQRVMESALAASALVLADLMDDPGNSATSKSMCAARLLETLDRLRELAPPPAVADGVDGLQERARLKLAT